MDSDRFVSAYQLPIRHSVFGWDDSISFSNMRAPNKILKLLRLHKGSLLVLQSDNNRIIMYSVLVPNYKLEKKESKDYNQALQICSSSHLNGCLLVKESMIQDTYLEEEEDIEEYDECRLDYDLLSTTSVDGEKEKAICIAMMRTWFFYSLGKNLRTSRNMTSKEFLSWVESESHMPSSF